jgi:hypothetical protein
MMNPKARWFPATSKSLSLRASGGLLGVLLVAATVGCGAYVDDAAGTGGVPGEFTSTTSEALSACASPSTECNTLTTYTASGTGSVTGPSELTHMCFATRFGATTTNYDPYMYIDRSGGKWRVNGWGQMTCAPLCCFTSNGGSADVRWVSSIYEAVAVAPAGRVTNNQSMWNGDAMPILSGLWHYGGAMSSLDYGVTSWVSKTAPTSIGASAYGIASTSSVGAQGYSLFVGKPHVGHNIKVSPAFDQAPYTALAGEVKKMISKNQGVCTFTKVAQISDVGTASIYQNSLSWYLSNTTPNAKVEARCYLYSQNQ